MARQASRLQIILFVCVALVFTFTLLSLTIDPSKDRESSWYEAVFLGALSPFQRGSTFVGQKVKNLFTRYVILMNVAEENQLLQQKQQQLEGQLLLFRQTVAENNRLRSLLEFQEARPWKSVAARVIAHNPQAEFRLLTINRGSQDGLKKRMPVVSSQGLIGQIYRIGRNSAQVLLLTDPTSAVDARLLDTGARGLIRGRVLSTKWDRSYFITALEYIDRIALVSIDGMVLTSGLDGVFPEGIPVGIVRKVSENPYGIFKEAEVVPMTDFMALREVLVIKDWED